MKLTVLKDIIPVCDGKFHIGDVLSRTSGVVLPVQKTPLGPWGNNYQWNYSIVTD